MPGRTSARGGQVPGGQVPGRTSYPRTSAMEDKFPPTFRQHQKRSGACPPGTCPPGTCPTGTCPPGTRTFLINLGI